MLALVAALALGAAGAVAAGPPILGEAWTSQVSSTSARLHAEINPNDLSTGYHFDYITAAAYEANLAGGKPPFAGAARRPASDASIGAGSSSVTVLQFPGGLSPGTSYRYRVVASNTGGTTAGPSHEFATFPAAAASLLADDRAWEMVSPVDKNGGQVDPPETLAGGGLLQAAAQGGAVTYSSAASFAGGSSGAPPASQYVASRGSDGWSTGNITTPLFSGSYDIEDGGVPYRLFSADIARGLLLNGVGCRSAEAECPVANPPLPGTDAPAGYQNYYLRSGSGFEALLGPSELSGLDPASFEVALAGASPDLNHVVLSACAALTGDAVDGCGFDRPNLYVWSAGTLSLVNTAPGAALGAQSGAVSSDGARIYWTDLVSGNLHLRAGAQVEQVDAAAGGGGSFEAAATDGAVAFFTADEHLWRYVAATGSATDLTPAGGVKGVLGASSDGSHVYYQDASALKLWNGGTTTTVAPGANAAAAGNYPPATGTARVTPAGTQLAFISAAPLTGYDNTDLGTGEADTQVFLYDASASSLTCVSCNPTNSRPLGPSSIPGARANGTEPESPHSYKPRVLLAGGERVFFDSDDSLALADTNNDTDAYQWTVQGAGSCTRAGGCVALISSGRGAAGASFVDASADGADAFFLTDDSLVKADPGSLDLYDARVGGGFPEPPEPIPCTGDSCQALPPEPVDPTLTTLLSGLGNPPVRYRKHGRKPCPQGKRRKQGRCVVKAKRGSRGSKRGGRR